MIPADDPYFWTVYYRYRDIDISTSQAEWYIRGHELPEFIVTFDGLTLPYGELGL